jgi:penicillin-binding protein 1A
MSLFAVSVRRFSILFYAGMTLAGLGALLAAGLFFMAVRDLPQVPAPLGRIIETPPTEIFAATGERLMIIGGREFVPLNRISPFFIQAVVATEDHRFWEHHGLDKLRTLKALWITLFEPGRIQGASTITQQLAKNLFFSYRRTYLRMSVLTALNRPPGLFLVSLLWSLIWRNPPCWPACPSRRRATIPIGILSALKRDSSWCWRE